MKILLVNSNRYHHPPVIPLGIEYLLGSLTRSRHSAAVADLCFASDPFMELRTALSDHAPDLIGISIRQIDSVLYQNNEFFLDDAAQYTALCHEAGLPVVLGGSGFSIMPHDIMAYTRADYGISGPGEGALIDLLDRLDASLPADRIIDGYQALPGSRYAFARIQAGEYQPYVEADGIVGFRTQIGCTGRCFFCVEGTNRIIFHDPLSVGREVRGLKECGYTRFHLCDSEFNISIDHSVTVCKALIQHAGTICWTLYMKPEPFNHALFTWLKKSGASMITLSIDTLSQTEAAYPQLGRFFSEAAAAGIDVIVDLSIGFPYEPEGSAQRMLEFLDAQPLLSVGVNSYYRVYPGTPLHRHIMLDTQLQGKLIAPREEKGFLYPTFFCRFPEEEVSVLIGGRSKFRVEGLEKATNYQRASAKSA
ncbi:MAG TPA: cobalamin-dependent protein [Thermodesulfobacteriota bacterium]|nr:cobalamin-dependent protein [Thermodesulfobacteriota bacterium]HNU71431.1 cobalamin-dependent protein [Thermodesulfobacteriota bacterium]